MKYAIYLLAIVVISCSPDQAADTSSAIVPADDYFQENVSLFDARIRSTDPSQYVKELVFKNFSANPVMPKTVNLSDVVFLDDGSGFDVTARDGIYTSTQVFNHDANFNYDSRQPIRSVLEAPIISPGFQYMDKLTNENAKYSLSTGRAQLISVTCKVAFGTKGCLAQQWGWCDSCCVTVYTNECEVTIGWP